MCETYALLGLCLESNNGLYPILSELSFLIMRIYVQIIIYS